MAEGSTVAEAGGKIGLTGPTWYRWRAEYEGCEEPPRLNRPDVPVSAAQTILSAT